MSPTSTSKGRSKPILRTVRVFGPENGDGPSLVPVTKYLSTLFPSVKFVIRPRLLRPRSSSARDGLASSFASARVKDPLRRTPSETPLWGEVDYECRVLDGDARAGGVVYDGRMVSALLARVVGSSNLEVANVVLTDRLLTTYSEEDLRHHLRTVVLGFPSVVSIPGIVEAPAKPRGYYVERQALEMAGASQAELESLKERYKGRFVDYGDPAVAEVLKRLVLQAVIFHLTLRPFCDKKNCRLFNAHWQEDLIASQLAPNGLCQIHKSEVRELGAMPRLQW